MNHYLVSAFSFSVFIPCLIALGLYKKIDRSYYPFLACLLIGSLNEALSFVLMNRHIYTTLNNNIYVFIESILLVWYFANKGIPDGRWLKRIIFFLLFTVWIAENFIFRSIFLNSTYFRIFYSLVIISLSIDMINHLFLECKYKLQNNPDFILCCCFVIYFTYKALLQAFIIYGLTRDFVFQRKIYDILVYINLGANLLYTLAVLWMPRKARFILPLS